jgi:L-rhamnose mutarotase
MTSKQIKPIFGDTNKLNSDGQIQRFAAIIGLKPEHEQQYRELHANVWPSVLKRIELSNIRNYSIYTANILGQKYLFSYFEYIGEELAKDLRAISLDDDTQRWWKETDKCQIRLPNSMPDENWLRLEELFHLL